MVDTEPHFLPVSRMRRALPGGLTDCGAMPQLVLVKNWTLKVE